MQVCVYWVQFVQVHLWWGIHLRRYCNITRGPWPLTYSAVVKFYACRKLKYKPL